MTLYQNSASGSSFQNYSAPSGLVKIVRSIQGAAPLATYYAPLGLKSVRSRTSSASRLTGLNPEQFDKCYSEPAELLTVTPVEG